MDNQASHAKCQGVVSMIIRPVTPPVKLTVSLTTSTSRSSSLVVRRSSSSFVSSGVFDVEVCSAVSSGVFDVGWCIGLGGGSALGSGIQNYQLLERISDYLNQVKKNIMTKKGSRQKTYNKPVKNKASEIKLDVKLRSNWA